MIHYAPPVEGSKIIDADQMYLCDSGAQYSDGKQLLLRDLFSPPRLNRYNGYNEDSGTFNGETPYDFSLNKQHFGTPGKEEKRAFTRVVSA